MVDTVDVPIIDTDWTEVSASATEGHVTNAAPLKAVLREAAVKPLSTVKTGHLIAQDESKTFQFAPGQKLWARSVYGPGLIVVTVAP